jgi:hypothetical protein
MAHMGLAQHAVHALPVLVVLAVLSRGLPGWLRSATGPSTRRWTLGLGGLLLGAATVHALAARDHTAAGATVVSFFAVVAGAQATLAAAVLQRPGRPVLAAAVLSSTALLLLWLWSRTVGVPLGYEGGVLEPVGWLDVLAGILQLSAVGAAAVLLRCPAVPAVRVRGEHLAWALIVVAGTGMLANA